MTWRLATVFPITSATSASAGWVGGAVRAEAACVWRRCWARPALVRKGVPQSAQTNSGSPSTAAAAARVSSSATEERAENVAVVVLLVLGRRPPGALGLLRLGGPPLTQELAQVLGQLGAGRLRVVLDLVGLVALVLPLVERRLELVHGVLPTGHWAPPLAPPASRRARSPGPPGPARSSPGPSRRDRADRPTESTFRGQL